MNKPEFLSAAAQPPFSRRYGNFIGGRWVEPVAGRYFDNLADQRARDLRGRPLGRRRRREGA